MKNGNPEKLKFSLIQLTFWCSWCAFTSFAALYLRKRGLSEGDIGLALSLSTLGGLCGQFFWGYLCDRFNTIKKVFITANIMILAAILSFLFIKPVFLIMAMMFLLGFAQIPQPSILDTWILRKLSQNKTDYGHIRLWASVGFSIFALSFGWAIQHFGFSIMFIAASVFIFITVFLTSRVFDMPDKEYSGSNIRTALKKMLSNKKYLFFVMLCFIIGLAFRTIHLLLPLIIDKVNGNPKDLGLAYFLGIIFEIPMLAASKRLSDKLNVYILLLVSVLLYILQFIILLYAKSPLMVIIAMIAQGLAFGNYLPCIRLFVYEASPENLRTSYQTIADAISSSLTAVIGSAAGGVLIEKHGVKTVLIIGICLLLTALIILLLKIITSKWHKKSYI